jgi:hypothetical protein
MRNFWNRKDKVQLSIDLLIVMFIGYCCGYAFGMVIQYFAR